MCKRELEKARLHFIKNSYVFSDTKKLTLQKVEKDKRIIELLKKLYEIRNEIEDTKYLIESENRMQRERETYYESDELYQSCAEMYYKRLEELEREEAKIEQMIEKTKNFKDAD